MVLKEISLLILRKYKIEFQIIGQNHTLLYGFYYIENHKLINLLIVELRFFEVRLQKRTIPLSYRNFS